MKTVLVPLAQGCEELEAVTITDILARAGAQVITAGLDDQPVKASRGLTLLPDYTLDTLPFTQFDLIVLPGGLPGADHLAGDARLQTLLQQQKQRDGLIAAICAAPRALIAADILSGDRITHYPGALDGFSGKFTVSKAAVEVDNRLTTGRGPGVALEFALVLVEQLFGSQKRSSVAAALAG